MVIFPPNLWAFDNQPVRLLVSIRAYQPANSIFLSQQTSISQFKLAQKPTSESAISVVHGGAGGGCNGGGGCWEGKCARQSHATHVCAPLCTHMPSSHDGDRSAENWSLEEEQEGRAVAAGRRWSEVSDRTCHRTCDEGPRRGPWRGTVCLVVFDF